MFIERPATQLIKTTLLGAAGAMPVGTSLKVGDSVTLMQADASVEVTVTAELVAGDYRGIVEAITKIDRNKFQASVNLVDVELKVGEIVEFAERQIHKCTRKSN